VTNLSNPIITIVRDPESILGKRFNLIDNGDIEKKSEVKVSTGLAEMHNVPNVEALAKLLRDVSEDPHAAIINASFEGVDVGESFLIYSEDRIRGFLNQPGAKRNVTKGLHHGTHNGKPIKIIGRLKENITPSSWQLIDRDIDASTPDKYANLSDDAYISELDKLLPGFEAVDKVITGSTSARVHRHGEFASKCNGHIWFSVADHGDVERLRAALIVRAAEQGMTWLKPRYSKVTGEVCGHSLTTILDTSVFTPGRLVFSGKPIADEGLVIEPQTIVIKKGNRTVIDTAQISLPDDKRVREVTAAAGVEMGLSGGSLSFEAQDLTMCTEIELKNGEIITVAEAVKLGENKIRCQTPFRESSSFAAFLAFDGRGWPFIYDVGTSTTHRLSRLEICQIEFSEPYEDIVELSPPGLESYLVDFRHNDALEFMPHVVDLWVPCDEVTLLAGHGGGGKSYVALNLAIHVALGLPVGSLATKQSKVLFFSGEDGSEVLKMRLAKLCRELELDRSQLLGKLYILDASDIDPALHREAKDDKGRVLTTQTSLLRDLVRLVDSLDIGFVIIDNASDTYDDDEIRRARVKSFVRSLRSNLGRPGRAVLLLVHVNKVSASNGRNAGTEDYSGSTAWHNSARSRLSLTSNGPNFITIEL